MGQLEHADPQPRLTPGLLQDIASMFGLLALGERNVDSLVDQVGQIVLTVGQHLGKLELVGLVRARRAGERQIYYIHDLVRLAIAHRQQGQTPANPWRLTNRMRRSAHRNGVEIWEESGRATGE